LTEARPDSLVRILASSLWFPALFLAGFLFCYLLPMHAPTPHHVPVVVVGEQAADQLDAALRETSPNSFEVDPVADEQAARDAILQRDAVAGYVPATGELFYAKANGMMLLQTLQQTFAPIAAAAGNQLVLTDLAPTAPGDPMVTGLFYCLLPMNIAPYIAVMMLLRTELSRRQKLLTIVGVGIVAAVVSFLVAFALDVIPGKPMFILLGFLLTQAVAWTTFGLVPLVKQFIPGVAIAVFVMLSVPSSGGAVPKELVHPFFQSLHWVLPLGQAVEAIRGVLYFDNVHTVPGALGLLAWWALGVLLVVVDHLRKQRSSTQDEAGSGEYEDVPEEDVVVDPSLQAPEQDPDRTLTGKVVDSQGNPVRGAIVTVTDARGVQLARIITSRTGEYRVHHLPRQFVTVVASASGMNPEVNRIAPQSGNNDCDFVLQPAGRTGAAVAGS
jgi:hypothetical protein